jgi:AraC family transcriptional regulator of adaptative response/methylated-DNA-[protein]-cysteine methyltransferase
MTTARGLCGLAFADPGTEGIALVDMKARWPNATYIHDPAVTAPIAARVFSPEAEREPLKILLGGTPFQLQVWRALLEIPFGETRSYTDIAKEVCMEKAVRAVGSAVGRNPISFLIPCHRVLRQTRALGGYHWGLTRKKALLAWEAAHSEAGA